jgi:hypothetical protein
VPLPYSSLERLVRLYVRVAVNISGYNRIAVYYYETGAIGLYHTHTRTRTRTGKQVKTDTHIWTFTHVRGRDLSATEWFGRFLLSVWVTWIDLFPYKSEAIMMNKNHHDVTCISNNIGRDTRRRVKRFDNY